VKKIETLQVSKHREDLDRPLVETRGGDRAPVGTLAHRDIDIPVNMRSGISMGNYPNNLSRPFGETGVRNP
jgi:hypothetical protein